MPDRADSYHVSLVLPEHTVGQLDEFVRHGHFANREEAMVAAVARLHADEATRHVTTRQAAFARLCGALQLGTTRASLRQEVKPSSASLSLKATRKPLPPPPALALIMTG